ncbi:hypothetical protein [Pasteurella atlantica]|uniref:hypothetical protein n=1 Tax=Pasteurellaceae TaxID=712 RepID=UPI00276443EB|nr:hypothetical protein [Pasteurella atlantica]MDP8099041.1 hypothetical protein [Pasteurella atlantica]MDP8107068.1 hypothetical protein [Pasteurella atlantica]MDP8116758.1 hypothetical protein [Pasteurella atlantica]
MKKLKLISILALAISSYSIFSTPSYASFFDNEVDSTAPIYTSGMGERGYAKIFIEWFNNKVNQSTERQWEEYVEATDKLKLNYNQSIKNKENKQEILQLTDDFIMQFLETADKNLYFTLEDWEFMIDPIVDENASRRSKKMVEYIIRELKYRLAGALFLPADLPYFIKNNLKDKGIGQNVYYYVLKNTKYPAILVDHKFMNSYKDRVVIQDLMIKIAKESHLDFYSEIDKLSLCKVIEKTINAGRNLGYDNKTLATFILQAETGASRIKNYKCDNDEYKFHHTTENKAYLNSIKSLIKGEKE